MHYSAVQRALHVSVSSIGWSLGNRVKNSACNLRFQRDLDLHKYASGSIVIHLTNLI